MQIHTFLQFIYFTVGIFAWLMVGAFVVSNYVKEIPDGPKLLFGVIIWPIFVLHFLYKKLIKYTENLVRFVYSKTSKFRKPNVPPRSIIR